jgi:hypothetical protein
LNLRPFKLQAGAFDEFPMSSSKQPSSIDKGNGVGSSILPLLVRLRYLRCPDK